MHPFVRIAQLLVRLGRIEGRKKFQKIVYILQSIGAPFEESFELSYFGAYSGELRGELDQLIKDGLVAEQEPRTQGRGYAYEPTPILRTLVEELNLSVHEPWLEVADQLNSRSSQELEGISTVLYLKNWGWHGDSLRHQFSNLKPHLAEDFDLSESAVFALIPSAAGM